MSKSTKPNRTALTPAEAKAWTKELTKAKKSACSISSDKCTKTKNQNAVDKSNVVLVVGDALDSTAIYVGGVKIQGVLHATLDFNPDAGFPTLHLEILNPVVKEYK